MFTLYWNHHRVWVAAKNSSQPIKVRLCVHGNYTGVALPKNLPSSSYSRTEYFVSCVLLYFLIHRRCAFPNHLLLLTSIVAETMFFAVSHCLQIGHCMHAQNCPIQYDCFGSFSCLSFMHAHVPTQSSTGRRLQRYMTSSYSLASKSTASQPA